MYSRDQEVNGYPVDDLGFLLSFQLWDDNFPQRMAAAESITEGLTDLHRGIIAFIRDHYLTTGRCPAVVRPCRCFRLTHGQFLSLFPSGYRHGALKLAGIPSAACDAQVPVESTVVQEYP